LFSFLAPRAVILLGMPQTRLYEVNGLFRSRNALLRFFLKGVEHVYQTGEAKSVNGPVGVAVKVLDNLQDATAAESFNRLR
jgi:hypothetical protein